MVKNVKDRSWVNDWFQKDLWTKDEFKQICCGIEPGSKVVDIEELNQVTEIINRAIMAGAIKPINHDEQGGTAFSLDIEYMLSDYFKPSDVQTWAQKKFPKFPKISRNLEELPKHNQVGLSNGSIDSRYWQGLTKKVKAAIEKYPSWSSSKKKIQKSANLHDWLTNVINADNREAEIIKKVLSDYFKELN